MSSTENPISGRILNIRGQRVILDADLARLYGTTTKRFNEAFQRNAARFPADFAFRLTAREFAAMRSQNVTAYSEGIEKQGDMSNWSQFATSSKASRRGQVYRPWAFTEHGAIMAATILRSARAVAMSVYVVRAFVQMKEALLTNAVILKRLAEVDKKLVTHDVILRDVYEKLRPLLAPPPEPPRKEMGYHTLIRKLGGRN